MHTKDIKGTNKRTIHTKHIHNAISDETTIPLHPYLGLIACSAKFDACQCHGYTILWAVQLTFKFLHWMSQSGLQCINTCSHKHLAGATPTRCSQQDPQSISASYLEFTQACYCWRFFFFFLFGHQRNPRSVIKFPCQTKLSPQRRLILVYFQFSWFKFGDFILLVFWAQIAHAASWFHSKNNRMSQSWNADDFYVQDWDL